MHAANRCQLAVLTACLSLMAHAGCTHRYLTYVTTELGYDAFVSDGKLQGASIDLLDALSRRSGCDIQVEAVPPARLDALRQSGKVPFLVLAGDRHDPTFQFTPLISMPTDLIIRRDAGVHTLDEAVSRADIIFGSVSGLTYGDWGNAFFHQLPVDRLDQSPSVEALYKKLGMGRIHATFGFSLMYQRNLDALGIRDNVMIFPVPNAPHGVAGLLISRQQVDERDAQQIVDAAKQLRDDGTVARLLARWLGEEAARAVIWRTGKRD
jgi:ABC-type amino acid transport substrate-binding protein